MAAGNRLLVTRTCEVCDWSREAVETVSGAIQCPLCYAPTRVVKREVLIPFVPGKNALAAALSQLGAAKGGKVRAERLTAGRRRDIARAAAYARWRKR